MAYASRSQLIAVEFRVELEAEIMEEYLLAGLFSGCHCITQTTLGYAKLTIKANKDKNLKNLKEVI